MLQFDPLPSAPLAFLHTPSAASLPLRPVQPVMATDYDGKLDEYEIYWRDRYTFLRSAGYTLRRRYKPDWSPSWKKTETQVFRYEDSTVGMVRYLVSCRIWSS